MSIILFEKDKIVFQLLLIVVFQLTINVGQLNIYNTEQTNIRNSLQYDCLNYYIYHEEPAYQHLSNVVDEIISYCFRPANKFDELFNTFINRNFQKISFKELYIDNITSKQLLSWSIPIELVERYEFYLNEPYFSLNEYIYNCTEPWFGSQCQYSFKFSKQRSFDYIVKSAFLEKRPYDILVEVPCYILLKCHRNGQPWCLDWREICDGSIDCFDEGLDEEFCINMEIHQCKEDEYQCHNGLCISKDLWEDGEGIADCLDRSDNVQSAFYYNECFQDPAFHCEEHSCGPYGDMFSCGDGQCVSELNGCYNGRDTLLIESMLVQGNLTDNCWTAMVCLTRLVESINENLCNVLLTNDLIYEFLKDCDHFFQFPAISVYSNHIRLFFENIHLKPYLNETFLPDYICYDQQLCDSIIPDLVYENLTCLKVDTLELEMRTGSDNIWKSITFIMKEYFRRCLVNYPIIDNEIKYNNHPSLYKCENSLKVISTRRILDKKQDCIGEDDEKYNNSCLLNHSYRMQCHEEEPCWSSILKSEICLYNNKLIDNEILFQKFCNGIEEYYFMDNDGNELNDESNCPDWWCNNMYTRCDGYWACTYGQDENNCNRQICPLGTYACISPINYTIICLSHNLVNDKINDDCLGAADEQDECRHRYPTQEFSNRFRCQNDSSCIKSSNLCDGENDCLLDDDENFCKNYPKFTCHKELEYNRTDIEEVLCGLSEAENRHVQQFSVYNSHIFPRLENNVINEIIHKQIEQHSSLNIIPIPNENNIWPWYCNRGLIISIWSENNYYKDACICPSGYYGHLCQYQNERISLTLRLSSTDRNGIYSIISMLIDENNQMQDIYSYDQFLYMAKQSCSIRLNRYLLFSIRPKNISKNYSVRIDVYEKNGMEYIGSWYYPIDFLFLPVNRLAISLVLSNNIIQSSSNCSFTCYNGKCIKYLNKEQQFCRCFYGWSGIQCNIWINRPACPSDSIYIGLINNRPICICPIHKFGLRCLFTSTCPDNICQNNGQCIPADVTIPGSSYTCICSDEFFGKNCEHKKYKLDVSLNNMYIPSYVVAYFFTLSNTTQPISTIMLRKLTLFQHIITFQISVPFHMVIIQVNDDYYLAALQHSPKFYISTWIDSTQKCSSIKQLFNSTILHMISYERIPFYYDLCRNHININCFFDEIHFCLCTNEYHANCMKFNRDKKFQCILTNQCDNNGQCLQDHPTCPSTKICVCSPCFFGNKCQFYAKGLGSTLDEILGYEFKRNTILSEQPFTVIVSVIITMLIYVIGLINGIPSTMTFLRKNSKNVGCGIYLLASSIVSLFIVTLGTAKFWFLFLSHQDYFDRYIQQLILNINCLCIEPVLKMNLYIDNWLNACVAIERTVSVFQGISFNKNRSKKIAKFVVILLLFINICLFIPQLINLHVFEDKIEQRSWCVITYSPWLQMYSSILIFFHYFAPLFINLCSAICIIIATARQGKGINPNRSFWIHLTIKLKRYKHLLISPLIIISLTIPHLIISIILDCNKSSHLFWFYLIGYFLSFTPATFIFVIFILPSPHYRQECNELMMYIHRRLIRLKLIFFKL